MAGRGHKLRVKRFRISIITAFHSPLVYSFTSLSNFQLQRVHPVDLIKYVDTLNDTKVPQAMLDLADKTRSRCRVVDKRIDLGKAEDGEYFPVVWDGLLEKRDWTWKEANVLYTKNFYKVFKFYSKLKEKNLVLKFERKIVISIWSLSLLWHKSFHGNIVARSCHFWVCIKHKTLLGFYFNGRPLPF